MRDREKLIALIDKARYGAAEMCHEKPSCKGCPHWDDRPHCRNSFIADHLIANGVVVREKGEWDDTGRYLFADGSLAIRCNLCGAALHQAEWDEYNWNFCPNCGADMRKGENDG